MMQFARDCKKVKLLIPKGMLHVMFFCILFLSSFEVKAQLMPVGAEFSGEWFFYHAQSQERPKDSQQNYSVRSVSQDEFWQKAYFLSMPTQIMFDGFSAQISHPSWSKRVVSVINDGKLEFRIFQENPEDFDKKPDINAIDLYPIIMPIYDLALNGEVMSLQSDYFYSDGQGNYTEGILTIYYKR